MAKRVPVEKAIRTLREVEVLQSQGSIAGEAWTVECNAFRARGSLGGRTPGGVPSDTSREA